MKRIKPLESIRNNRVLTEELFESTTYRLNDQVCPYCLVKENRMVKISGALFYMQCPNCGLSFDYHDKIGNMQTLGILGLKPLQENLKYNNTNIFNDVVLVIYEDGKARAIQSDDDLVEYIEKNV